MINYIKSIYLYYFGDTLKSKVEAKEVKPKKKNKEIDISKVIKGIKSLDALK